MEISCTPTKIVEKVSADNETTPCVEVYQFTSDCSCTVFEVPLFCIDWIAPVIFQAPKIRDRWIFKPEHMPALKARDRPDQVMICRLSWS